MKKWSLFLTIVLCLCLLASCGAAGSDPAPGGAPPEAPPSGGEVPPSEASLVCRIVSGAAEGHLLLAELDGPGVYRLAWESEDLRDGALVEVGYNGSIQETFPAQLGDVSSVTALSWGFDDRCRLYLDVLADLWAVDEGLNADVTQVGVDLSQTSLPESEQAAVAWAFGEAHGALPVQGTYEELVDQGYITGEPLEGTDALFYRWADGCLFSIAEQPMEGSHSLLPVTFDAEKWRSGLGAYFLSDCTALQSADGSWGDYTVGSEAIA